MARPPGGPVASADDDVRAQVVQHQQRADAVHVGGALLRQPGELAVRAARVFVLGRGLMHHRPHTLAAMMAQQHRQQLVAIEPVGLGPPGVSVHLDAGGVDHDVVHTLLDQPAVQPPAVAACFVARVHLGLRRELAALSGLADAVRNCGRVAGVHVVPARAAVAIARCHLPGLVAELEARVQLALDRRILTLWDCLGCRHFHLLPRS
ncbi:hypothetical protein [Variovorax sp. CF079]|uniref:hypothetical protein n=1 Tax=Variovorax sp. CF079 TaxID=1882774 RepID=UPI001FCD9934|nr:hypothetical protein [Variovorax sp. CF079]